MSSNATKKINTAYAKFPPDIRNILETVRAVIHKAEPSINEAWKWGPAFEKNGLVMGLWGFRNHVSFVFYRGAEMKDKHKLFNAGFDNAKNRMIKFTSIKEVNTKKIADYVKEAVKLNAKGRLNVKKAVADKKKAIVIPADLKKWLSTNKKAKLHFESLAFTYQKEMIQSLNSAKQDETRKRRFVKVTSALSRGKHL